MYRPHSAALTNASPVQGEWDRLWRWTGCKSLKSIVNANLQPLSHLTVPALPRHAYVGRRHYSGALTQGSLYEANADLHPSDGYAAGSTKARLRILQALFRFPYTVEPIEVCTDPIQRHKPMPPLCKGRGTADCQVKCNTF